jgi:hypothetical protein
MKTRNEAMRYITVQKKRARKFRVRVGTFDSSFTDLDTAKMVRNFEARKI